MNKHDKQLWLVDLEAPWYYYGIRKGRYEIQIITIANSKDEVLENIQKYLWGNEDILDIRPTDKNTHIITHIAHENQATQREKDNNDY